MNRFPSHVINSPINSKKPLHIFRGLLIFSISSAKRFQLKNTHLSSHCCQIIYPGVWITSIFPTYMQPQDIDQALGPVEKHQIFQTHGSNKRGQKILRVIGKFFLGGIVSIQAMKRYLNEKILPEFEKQLFAIVYLHTDVEKSENFVEISVLSWYVQMVLKWREEGVNVDNIFFEGTVFCYRQFQL